MLVNDALGLETNVKNIGQCARMIVQSQGPQNSTYLVCYVPKKSHLTSAPAGGPPKKMRQPNPPSDFHDCPDYAL